MKRFFQKKSARKEEPSEHEINAKRLETLLSYSIGIMDSDRAYHKTDIFSLIKLLTENMTLNSVMDLLTTDKNPKYPYISHFFIHLNPEADEKHKLSSCLLPHYYKDEYSFEDQIHLATDPVLTFPWVHGRLVDSLTSIGSPDEPWEEDRENHRVALILPVGVSFFYNGLHSSFAGMLKREGAIKFSKDCYHQILDISPLFELLRFDGTTYIIKETGEIAGKAMSFEFGCIFEIGRLLNERGICFHNLNNKKDS